ncbi:Chromosome segregation protein SMC, partial [Giardia duodenalis]
VIRTHNLWHKILNFMSGRADVITAVREVSGGGDFDMTSPTCTDISPVIHPPSFPAVTHGYYTPSTMNYGTPSRQDTDGLSELQQSGRVIQPARFPSHNTAKPTSQLSGSALCGAIEVDELSSTSQDVTALSNVSNKRVAAATSGAGRPNRFAHLTANSSGRSFTRPPQTKPDPVPQQDFDLSQSISMSMTSELSRLEVTEDDEQQLRRQGVSIDSIQRTLDFTYPDATDAQKIRKLLQLLANSTIANNRLQAEKDELVQLLRTKDNDSEQATINYHAERAKLFEGRVRAAEEKLAQTEQELLEYKRELRAKNQELSSTLAKLNEATTDKELERELEHEKAHSALLQDERDKYSAEVQYLRKYVDELEDTLAATKSNLLEAQTDLREMFAKLSTQESNQLKQKISELEEQISELGTQLKEATNQPRETHSSEYAPPSLQASQHIEAMHLTYQQQVLDKQMEIIALQTQLQQMTTELDEQAQFQATLVEQHHAEKTALEAENRALNDKMSALTRSKTGLSLHVHTDSTRPKIQMETIEETIYSESDATNVAASIVSTPSQFKNINPTPSEVKHTNKNENFLEQENQHLRQENDKLKNDKIKLKNALKQIKQLQREYEASQNMVSQDTTSGEEDNGSKRSSLGSNTEDAVMVPGTMIPRPTELLRNKISLLKTDLASANDEIAGLKKQLIDKEEARLRLEVEKNVLSERIEENEHRMIELHRDLARSELEKTHSDVTNVHKAKSETADKGTSTDSLSIHDNAPSKMLMELDAQCVALKEQLEEEKQSASTLQEKLRSLEKEKDQLLENLQERDRSLVEAETTNNKVEELTAQVTDLKSKLEAAERQNRSYNSLLVTMHSANSANTDKLRLIESREQVELARRDEMISMLRNEILVHQSEIGLLKEELYLRDEETRRLMKKNIALEAGYFGVSSNQSYCDTAAGSLAATTDTISSYPIVDTALRSTSRQIRSQLNTTIESGLHNF